MAKPILTDFMNNELNLPNNAYPLDVFVALSELQDDVVEAQAAAAAKMEELAALRTQTAELFAERLMAEGADDEAVSAAKAMWAENPSLAAQAALGADIIEAANPYGCNQYGEGWKQPHNGKQSWRPGNPANKKDEVDLDRDPDVNENGVDLKTGTTSKSRVNGAKNRHQAAQKLLRQFRKEVEKHDSESQEAKVWKSALVEAEKLALNISKATSVIIENPNGKTMRRAGEESFDELQKLRNLFHRTSLETKNKTADEKDEEEAIKLVQQALRKAAEEDEGDAHEMTLSEMLDDEDNKRH